MSFQCVTCGFPTGGGRGQGPPAAQTDPAPLAGGAGSVETKMSVVTRLCTPECDPIQAAVLAGYQPPMLYRGQDLAAALAELRRLVRREGYVDGRRCVLAGPLHWFAGNADLERALVAVHLLPTLAAKRALRRAASQVFE